jgi:hypothetical protein
MHVKLADSVEFDQFKTTVTTIRIFPPAEFDRTATNTKADSRSLR